MSNKRLNSGLLTNCCLSLELATWQAFDYSDSQAIDSIKTVVAIVDHHKCMKLSVEEIGFSKSVTLWSCCVTLLMLRTYRA